MIYIIGRRSGQIGPMSDSADLSFDSSTAPSRAAMQAANVNPETGLATDFLNPFNEYVMLAEMVADGSMPDEVLRDWRPIDYESHFAGSGFQGADVVLAAYRHLPPERKSAFETAVNELIETILAHQSGMRGVDIADIGERRDRVASMVSSAETTEVQSEAQLQADIDALFD